MTLSKVEKESVHLVWFSPVGELNLCALPLACVEPFTPSG